MHLGSDKVCDVCKFVVSYLKTVVDANTTVEEAEDLLKKVCSFLPDTVSAQVRDFIMKIASDKAVIIYVGMPTPNHPPPPPSKTP